MRKDLKSFCQSAAIYSRIRNALWKQNGGETWPPPDNWEPSPDDFLRLNPKTIPDIGSKSLAILREWVKENE